MAQRNPEPEGTRENIRRTASSLFTANGVHATSLADIAQAAKLSKGTLYYHYPSKEELVLEISERYFSEITAAIYSWIDEITLDTSPEQAFDALSRGLRRSRETMRLYFALLSEALREESALCTLFRVKQKEWAVMMEVGALKLTGAGAQRFRRYSRIYFAMLDGLALHGLLDDQLDIGQLHKLLAEA